MFEATKTQKGFIEFVTNAIGKDNLYAKQDPIKTRNIEVEWKGTMHETQWGYIFVPTEKRTIVMRMSSKMGGYIFSDGRDEDTDIIKLPRADSSTEARLKSDSLGKLSHGVVTTKLGLAIRVLKTNKEKAQMQLSPEMTQLVGTDAMLCEDRREQVCR